MKRNNLVITNINDLLKYEHTDDFYKSGIEIIYELEQKVKYLDHVKLDFELINYKPDGFAMFELESFKKEKESITYYFQFTGFAS